MSCQNYRLSVDECQTKKIPTNTNPRYKHFVQTMFTAGDKEQFNRGRVKKTLIRREVPDFSNNVYKTLVFPEIWEKHKALTSEAVNNTFLYLFNKFKKGIFVRIYNNKLECFIPFSNAHYYNDFSNLIRINPKYTTVEKFIEYIASLQNYKVRQKIKPVNEWFANNSLIRFDYTETDNNTAVLYDLLITLCNERAVPDIEFFINRRDYPQFRKDGCEPYDQIYGDHQPLVSHNYDKYSPIISFSGNSRFADILMPTYEDWSRAVYQETGKVFPRGCQTYPEIKSQFEWKSKIKKAVFRGSTTGTGVSNGIDGKPEPVNQRLSAYVISEKNTSFIDYGITKWNLRPRKLYKYQYLETIEAQDKKKPYLLANRLSLQQQSEYKYILNLEGNVAAYRLSYELSSGSVILLAKSKWKMWYNNILIPYTHYVPVQEDLSDLITQIIWCIENDEKCRQIAHNAKVFYDKYLGTRGILDFWQARLWHMSASIGVYSYFPDLVTSNVLNEIKILNTSKRSTVKSRSSKTIQNLHSYRCIGLLQGIMRIFQNSSLFISYEGTTYPANISFVKQIYRSAGSVIQLFTLHGFKLIGKTCYNNVKILENYHESFIGIKTINSLVAKLPHFCYVFGPISNTNDTPKTIFLEYIEGISLFDWLKSPHYNFKHLLSILVQINLALQVAQNSSGFVHNDLYPWNIMVSSVNNLFYAQYGTSLHTPKQIQYYIDTKTVLAMTPEIIPVIVDYGKSRSVVYEKEWGLIDHGFSNSYRHGQMQDTLSLLYSVLNVLSSYENRFTNEEAGLLQFAKQIGVPDYDNIERWSRFGMLFDFTSVPYAPINKRNNQSITPKHFVDFILTMPSSVQRPEVHRIDLDKKKFNYVMEYGPNPIFVEHFLKTGNRINALQEVVKSINYSRFPFQNAFFIEMFKSLANRHLLWLNLEFNKPETPIWLQKQWAVVNKVFNVYSFVQQEQQQFDINPPHEIYFDESISLETILKLTLKLDKQDWINIIDGIIEAYLFRMVPLNDSYLNLCNINRFELFNRIASHCTLHKLAITEETNNL
jgi:serine/threonine protein kinase